MEGKASADASDVGSSSATSQTTTTRSGDEDGESEPPTAVDSSTSTSASSTSVSSNDELARARHTVQQQAEELNQLRMNRTKMEAEVQDLTASLFEQANKMVNDAAMDKFMTEKALKEARLQIDGLQAEVAALKTLVLTSTPSNPNLNHHGSAGFNTSPGKLFGSRKGHQKCASQGSVPFGTILQLAGSENGGSHHVGGDASSLGLCCDHDCKKGRGKRRSQPTAVRRSMSGDLARCDENPARAAPGAVGIASASGFYSEDDEDDTALWDPRLLEGFREWRRRCAELPAVASVLIRSGDGCGGGGDGADDDAAATAGVGDDTAEALAVAGFFLRGVLEQEIDPCLDFPNAALKSDLRSALRSNAVIIECRPSECGRKRECGLLLAPRRCDYVLRLCDGDTGGVPISELCRNRITAVCDFLNYLNYIQRGLVKSSDEAALQEIVRLRKKMALAKLGCRID